MLSLNEILEQLDEENASLDSVDDLLSQLDEAFNSNEVKDILAAAIISVPTVPEYKPQSFSQSNSFFLT